MTVLHEGLDSVPPEARGAVLLIGNFDGIHLGHRALVTQARRIANAAGAPLALLTFEPHPRQFFQPSAEPFRLTLPPMKLRLLSELGLDHVFAVKFDAAFAALSPEAFIDDVLAGKLHASHILVGEDFAFGRMRTGSVATLRRAAEAEKFQLTPAGPVRTPEGQVYSSSSIRSLLRQGHLSEAEKLLGWAWQIEAPVVHGDKRGRTLGFPTANQNIPEYVRIPYGIYAVQVQIGDETGLRAGVASFGVRPMFKLQQPILETFIFDFDAEIYGKTLRVQPVAHLRPEASFKDTDALIAQMKEDCIKAKAVLKSIHRL